MGAEVSGIWLAVLVFIGLCGLIYMAMNPYQERIDVREADYKKIYDRLAVKEL